MADIFYYVTQIVWFYHCPNRIRNLKVNTEIEIIENIFRQNINDFLISWNNTGNVSWQFVVALVDVYKGGKIQTLLNAR